jgi:hypothetical protein
MNFQAAGRYVAGLNSGQYGGIDSWRLPTLEEALSLALCYYGAGMESSAAFEDGVFWTADTRGPIREYDNALLDGDVWVVYPRGIPKVEPPGQEAGVKCVSTRASVVA